MIVFLKLWLCIFTLPKYINSPVQFQSFPRRCTRTRIPGEGHAARQPLHRLHLTPTLIKPWWFFLWLLRLWVSFCIRVCPVYIDASRALPEIYVGLPPSPSFSSFPLPHPSSPLPFAAKPSHHLQLWNLRERYKLPSWVWNRALATKPIFVYLERVECVWLLQMWFLSVSAEQNPKKQIGLLCFLYNMLVLHSYRWESATASDFDYS